MMEVRRAGTEADFDVITYTRTHEAELASVYFAYMPYLKKVSSIALHHIEYYS